MFTLQKHPKWMLFTVIMCWFCWRQNCPLHLVLNLWPSGDAHRLSDHCHLCARPLHKTPSPWVSFIQSADVLRQHYFCESNSVIRRSDSGARAMPPTWHMRLVSALAAAMPISSTEKDGWAARPRTTHAKHRADTPTRSHHSPLRSQMMGRDQSGGWQFFFFLASERDEYNGVFLAGGLRGQTQGGRGSEEVWWDVLYTVHTADVSSTHLLCFKKGRTFFFFTHRQVRSCVENIVGLWGIRTFCSIKCYVHSYNDKLFPYQGCFYFYGQEINFFSVWGDLEIIWYPFVENPSVQHFNMVGGSRRWP